VVRARAMGTVNISLPDEMIERIDLMIKKMNYASRSELVRGALRDFFIEAEWMVELTGPALAVVTTTFNIESRGVSEEVNRLQHKYERLILSMTHSHMGNTCVEVILARGDMNHIRGFAEELKELSGVRKVRVTVA